MFPFTFVMQAVTSIIFCFKGKGIYGFLTGSKGRALRVLQKISTPAGSIFHKNLDSPKPYTFYCP
jgi:hypothetical protein